MARGIAFAFLVVHGRPHHFLDGVDLALEVGSKGSLELVFDGLLVPEASFLD
jgi:hypothetical protein